MQKDNQCVAIAPLFFEVDVATDNVQYCFFEIPSMQWTHIGSGTDFCDGQQLPTVLDFIFISQIMID